MNPVCRSVDCYVNLTNTAFSLKFHVVELFLIAVCGINLTVNLCLHLNAIDLIIHISSHEYTQWDN